MKQEVILFPLVFSPSSLIRADSIGSTNITRCAGCLERLQENSIFASLLKGVKFNFDI